VLCGDESCTHLMSCLVSLGGRIESRASRPSTTVVEGVIDDDDDDDDDCIIDDIDDNDDKGVWLLVASLSS